MRFLSAALWPLLKQLSASCFGTLPIPFFCEVGARERRWWGAQELMWNSSKETYELFTPERCLPMSNWFTPLRGRWEILWFLIGLTGFWLCGMENSTKSHLWTSQIWRILVATLLGFISCPQMFAWVSTICGMLVLKTLTGLDVT